MVILNHKYGTISRCRIVGVHLTVDQADLVQRWCDPIHRHQIGECYYASKNRKNR